MTTLIYYIEDDEDIARSVQLYLQKRDLSVQTAETVEQAKALFSRALPSLVLIDWNLPDGSGDKLCRWIRGQWSELPLLFLTVRGDTSDILRGFREGADDYITKPFDLEVLHSRIQAVLRRAGITPGGRLSCGPISVDRDKMQVFFEEETVTLSFMEYQLLLTLLENKDHTVTRQRLLETIWDANGNFVNDNTLTVTVKRLREKLRRPSCLKTIRSFGYRMEEDRDNGV